MRALEEGAVQSIAEVLLSFCRDLPLSTEGTTELRVGDEALAVEPAQRLSRIACDGLGKAEVVVACPQ